jgi:hypothetical protein
MQLKGGRLYFGSQFQRVQSMVDWLLALEMNIMVYVGVAHIMADRKQSKENTRMGQGNI